jgi:pilus assembly protein Flp/PilA
MLIRAVFEWIGARLHVDDERGASLVEYALLLSLIAVVCLAAVTFLGSSASSSYSRSTSSMFGP